MCDKIPAANYKRYACTEANAYQKVSDLTFSIASRSTKFVSVRHVFSNAQPQGIAICISGHTPSESGYTVLKSEDTSIQCTSGLIINGGNSVVNYDVYVKQATANTNGNDVVVYRSADYAF